MASLLINQKNVDSTTMGRRFDSDVIASSNNLIVSAILVVAHESLAAKVLKNSLSFMAMKPFRYSSSLYDGCIFGCNFLLSCGSFLLISTSYLSLLKGLI